MIYRPCCACVSGFLLNEIFTCTSLHVLIFQKYDYAGIEAGKECWCANSFTKRPLPQIKCNTRCPSDKKRVCGGNFALSIYQPSKYYPYQKILIRLWGAWLSGKGVGAES